MPMPAMRPSATRLIPPDHVGPRPHGGVGGTRTGLKCLHAHYAWYLAGGDDPVGAWVARRARWKSTKASNERGDGTAGDDDTLVDVDGQHHVIPVGAATLTSNELVSDPPRPESCTNAIGLVVDHLDDLLRARARGERCGRSGHRRRPGHRDRRRRVRRHAPLPFPLPRAAVEDVFRTVATESAAERALNPGLPATAVDTIVAACCILVAIMRHLHLDRVDVNADVGAQP